MSLKQRAFQGVKWTSTSAVVIAILQFLQLAVLSRLLTPTDFGLMGIVLVVIGFVRVYADMGISQAIIHRQDATKEQLSVLYWLCITVGIGLFGLISLLSPFIGDFFQEPKLNNLISLTAIIFLIIPFGQQFQILMQKELHFDRLAKVEIFSSVTGAIITLILAYAGFGVFSLVLGQLSQTISKTVLLISGGWQLWHPQFFFGNVNLTGFISFGLYQMGERSVNYLSMNVDRIIIGKMLGTELLGYYTLAFNLIIYPTSLINPIINQVSFPVFAKVQNQLDLLKKGYLDVLHILSTINFPIYFGLGVTAPILIPFIFGEQWVPSILIVQILAGVGLLRSTGNPVGSLLLARGHAKLGFTWNLLLMFTQIPGIIIGAYFSGMVGVAVAYVLLQCMYFILSYPLLVKRVLGPCAWDYVYSMLPAFWMSVAMSIVVWLVGFVALNLPEIMILIVQVLVGIVIYALLLLTFQRKFIMELQKYTF